MISHSYVSFPEGNSANNESHQTSISLRPNNALGYVSVESDDHANDSYDSFFPHLSGEKCYMLIHVICLLGGVTCFMLYTCYIIHVITLSGGLEHVLFFHSVGNSNPN